MHPPDQQNSEQTTEARTDARPPQPNSPPKGQSRFPRQENRPRPRLRSEAFAGLGLVAAEIFRYNRQNFAFDQDQRFNRDAEDGGVPGQPRDWGGHGGDACAWGSGGKEDQERGKAGKEDESERRHAG